MTRILTTLTKPNGSLYALIPQSIAENLDLINDKKILIDFMKYKPSFMRFCEDAKTNNKTIEIIYHNKSTPSVIGKITEYNQENVILFNESLDESLRVPFSLLAEIHIIEPEVKDGI